jgi:hypothetical protein
MDILDDWTRGQAQHPPVSDGDIITGVEAFEVLDAEAPIFSIDRVERRQDLQTLSNTVDILQWLRRSVRSAGAAVRSQPSPQRMTASS